MNSDLQQQAAQALAQGDYGLAIATYEQCIAVDPGFPGHYWQLGLAWLLQGEVAEAQGVWLTAIAEAGLEQADRLLAELLQVLDAAATIQLQAGKAPLAQDIYEQMLEADPERAVAHYGLGWSIALQGDLDAAIACWQDAIAIQPDFAQAHQSQGTLFQKMAQWPEASTCYQKVLALQPQQWETRYNLGLCEAKQGDLAAAIACFAGVLEQQPDFSPAYGEWGYALLQQGKLDAAIDLWCQAIQRQPWFVRAYCCRYANLTQANQPETELTPRVAFLEGLLQREPDRMALFLALGQVLSTVGQGELAIATYQATLSQQPNARTYRELGKALATAGQPDAAQQTYEMALQLQPNCVDTRLALSRLLLPQNPATALALCQSALQLQPNSATVNLVLGNALINNGQLHQAIAAYQKALALDPDSHQIHANLALAFIQDDRPQEALQCLQTVLKHNPDLADWVAAAIFQRGNTANSAPNDHPQFSLSPAARQPLLPSAPPTGFYEKTCDWIAKAQLEPIAYQELHPQTTLPLVPPITPDGTAHFSFRFPSQVTLPAAFVVTLPDGRYWLSPDQQSSATLTPDNQLLGDLSPEFPVRSPGHPDSHPRHHSVFSRHALPPVTDLEGTVAVLTGLFNNTYFHWMFDILPRIELLRRRRIDLNAIDRFLIDCQLPFQQETLQRLNIPTDKILSLRDSPHIRAKQLLVPSFPASVAWMPQWACDFLRREFLPETSATVTEKIDRIYISRQQASYRRILNEAEVMQTLAEYGFQSVTLESKSVRQQAALFANASAIVAPHGGGLTNLVFCQAGTPVMEIFSPHFVYPCYWLVSNIVGLKYYYFLGESLPGPSLHRLIYPHPRIEDIFVDIEALRSHLTFAGLS